jgi:hypothetical protein
MFVILTSRPGQCRTELGDGLEICEAYDYHFYGQQKAQFVIAELLSDVIVRVIDETPPERVDEIPSRFLPKFSAIGDARAELQSLINFGGIDAMLCKLT